MRTLLIDAQRPIESRLLDPANKESTGNAAYSISRKYEKPMREFSVKSWDTMLRDQIEIIRNEIHAGRVTATAWFDGDQWGNVRKPIFIAEGDGIQEEFPMPFDNCFPSSWKIWVNQTLTTTWAMVGDTLIFTSAPSGRITGIGKHKFRVIIVDNAESLLTESQIYTNTEEQGVYSMTPIVLREVQGMTQG